MPLRPSIPIGNTPQRGGLRGSQGSRSNAQQTPGAGLGGDGGHSSSPSSARPSVVVYSRTPSTRLSESERDGAAKKRKLEPRRPKNRPSEFPEYKCQWQAESPQACNAQLHDINTLRQHVEARHSTNKGGRYACHWKDCGTLVISDYDDFGETQDFVPIDFKSAEEWSNHMWKAHLQPLEQQIQMNRQRIELPETYLSDSSGRVVTPIIRASRSEHVSAPQGMHPHQVQRKFPLVLRC